MVEYEDKKVEVDFPIAPVDYIMWKQCLVDKTVACSDHELRHKGAFPFYLVDTNKDEEEALLLQDSMDTLDKLYLKLVVVDDKGKFKDASKVDAALRLLGKNPTTYDFRLKKKELSDSKEDSKQLLKEGIKLDLTLFYRVVNDKDLGIKSTIMMYVEKGLLQKAGEYFRDPSNDMQIGANLNDAVRYFKDQNNNEHVNDLAFRSNGKVSVQV